MPRAIASLLLFSALFASARPVQRQRIVRDALAGVRRAGDVFEARNDARRGKHDERATTNDKRMFDSAEQETLQFRPRSTTGEPSTSASHTSSPVSMLAIFSVAIVLLGVLAVGMDMYTRRWLRLHGNASQDGWELLPRVEKGEEGPAEIDEGESAMVECTSSSSSENLMELSEDDEDLIVFEDSDDLEEPFHDAIDSPPIATLDDVEHLDPDLLPLPSPSPSPSLPEKDSNGTYSPEESQTVASLQHASGMVDVAMAMELARLGVGTDAALVVVAMLSWFAVLVTSIVRSSAFFFPADKSPDISGEVTDLSPISSSGSQNKSTT